METFKSYRMVRQEHLNHYGSLFGGHLLLIIDEMAAIAVFRTFPGCNFVTRALDKVEFHVPAHNGDILETHAEIEHVGKTSCRVRICVYICPSKEKSRRLSFDGKVIMVCVDDNGKSVSINSTAGV